MLVSSRFKKTVFAVGASVAVVAAVAASQSPHVLPDPSLTPGKIVVDATAKDVCRRGYARSARHVTRGERKRVFAAYGLPGGNHTGYCSGAEGCELDHLVSLELGGSNDTANLWPEPYAGPWNAHVKDRLGNRLHKMVCDGRIGLAEAQRQEAQDWIGAYRRIFGDGPLVEH